MATRGTASHARRGPKALASRLPFHHGPGRPPRHWARPATGAGKSTPPRTLDGLETPSSGVVRIDGEAVGRADVRAAGAVDG